MEIQNYDVSRHEFHRLFTTCICKNLARNNYLVIEQLVIDWLIYVVEPEN